MPCGKNLFINPFYNHFRDCSAKVTIFCYSANFFEDEAAKEAIRNEALVLAAQETAAVNRGYKKFSKVKDEAEIEAIKAEAIEIAETKKNEGGFGVTLASAWVPLLIASAIALAAGVGMILFSRPKSASKAPAFSKQNPAIS